MPDMRIILILVLQDLLAANTDFPLTFKIHDIGLKFGGSRLAQSSNVFLIILCHNHSNYYLYTSCFCFDCDAIPSSCPYDPSFVVNKDPIAAATMTLTMHFQESFQRIISYCSLFVCNVKPIDTTAARCSPNYISLLRSICPQSLLYNAIEVSCRTDSKSESTLQHWKHFNTTTWSIIKFHRRHRHDLSHLPPLNTILDIDPSTWTILAKCLHQKQQYPMHLYLLLTIIIIIITTDISKQSFTTPAPSALSRATSVAHAQSAPSKPPTRRPRPSKEVTTIAR